MLASNLLPVISINMEITDNPGRVSQSTPEFDLVAPFYPGLERLVFGTHLNNARQTFLLEILKANQVLLVGEGNGRFLKNDSLSMSGCESNTCRFWSCCRISPSDANPNPRLRLVG